LQEVDGNQQIQPFKSSRLWVQEHPQGEGEKPEAPEQLPSHWRPIEAGKNSLQTIRLKSTRAIANVAAAKAQKERAKPAERPEARLQWKTVSAARVTSIKSDKTGPGAEVPSRVTTAPCASNRLAARTMVVRARATTRHYQYTNPSLSIADPLLAFTCPRYSRE